MADPLTIATIVGNVLGAGASLVGSNRAADAAEQATNRALRQQGVSEQRQLALARPLLNTSNAALRQLSALYGLPDPGGVSTDPLDSITQQGLSELPGVTWNGRAVFQDPNGALYTSRGRNASVGSSGVEFLGTPVARPNGQVKIQGEFLKGPSGKRLTFGDGTFTTRAGEQITPVSRETTAGQPAQEGVAAPATGNVLEDLVANNPILQFQRERAEDRAVDQLAARGLNESGPALEALAELDNNLIAQGTQQFVIDPLFELAGFGPRAVANTQNVISTGANNLSNLALGQGNNRASSFQNQGNILGNLIAGTAPSIGDLIRRRRSAGGGSLSSAVSPSDYRSLGIGLT